MGRHLAAVSAFMVFVGVPSFALPQSPLPDGALLELRPETAIGAGGALEVSPDGRWLVAAGIGEGVRVWDLTGRLDSRVLKSAAGYVAAVAFSHDSRRLFAAGKPPAIQVWGLESGQPESEVRLPDENRIYLLAASPDGRRLAAHGWPDRSRVTLWDLSDGSMTEVAVGPKQTDDVLLDMAFSPDGKLLAAAHLKGRVRLWDPTSREEVQTLRLDSGRSVAFSRDGRMLAAGGRIVSVWETGTWKQIASWRASTEGSNLPSSGRLAFSPDGQRLAGASTGAVVRLWQVPSGARIAEHETRHRSGIAGLRLAFAPSGRWFATLDAGGVAAFWHGTTGRYLAGLTVWRDGTAWAIGSSDGYFDGSVEGLERAIGWRVADDRLPAAHFPGRRVPGLLGRLSSGEHAVANDEHLAAVGLTQAEGMARFQREAATRAAAREAENRAHPFGGLAETLARAPLHGGTLFTADALQKIFAASGCEGTQVLQTRIDTTDVWMCIDKKAGQRAVLNVIRPAGPHPLIYVNSLRKLYAPDTGYAITRSGPVALMMGGTVVDTDFGTYRVTRIGGALTQALGASGQLVALRGQANQFLVIEYTGSGERIMRGLSQSRQGKLVRFNIADGGLAYYVEDLRRLEHGDTFAMLGEKGSWWSAQVASPLDSSGVLRINPVRLRVGERDALVQELVVKEAGPEGSGATGTAVLVAR
jgi:WD40 repeat protein